MKHDISLFPCIS